MHRPRLRQVTTVLKSCQDRRRPSCHVARHRCSEGPHLHIHRRRYHPVALPPRRTGCHLGGCAAGTPGRRAAVRQLSGRLVDPPTRHISKKFNRIGSDPIVRTQTRATGRGVHVIAAPDLRGDRPCGRVARTRSTVDRRRRHRGARRPRDGDRPLPHAPATRCTRQPSPTRLRSLRPVVHHGDGVHPGRTRNWSARDGAHACPCIPGTPPPFRPRRQHRPSRQRPPGPRWWRTGHNLATADARHPLGAP